MSGWWTAWIVASTLVGASPPESRRDGNGDGGETRAAREVQRLQGDWTMVSLEVDGKQATPSQVKTWLLVIEGDKYNPGSGDESLEYTFRVDPTRLPAAIDLIPADGPNQGKVFRAVYALEGDRLTVCRPLDPETDRPAGLLARRGSGLSRVVWKRRTGSGPGR